jgi:phosphoserine phosphatase
MDECENYWFDFDGTWIYQDSTVEMLKQLFSKSIFKGLLCLRYILLGRLKFKSALWCETEAFFDFSRLQTCSKTLEYAKIRHQDGKKFFLISAAPEALVRRFFQDDAFFEEIFASTNDLNLKGLAKVATMQEKSKSFAYIGNSMDDLSVWRYSKLSICVNESKAVRRRAKRLGLNLISLETLV